MCLYPRLRKNKKYIPNKKNGGIVPPIKDKRVIAVPIGCGRCIECKKKKSRDWQVRLHEEIRHNKNGKFVTLSFSDEKLAELQNEILNKKEYWKLDKKGKLRKPYGYELENITAKLAIRRFRWRWKRKYNKSVRRWLVTELGKKNTERLHLHGILFTNQTKEEIEERWEYGNVWIGEYVNEKTINYIVKYINKVDEVHKNYNPKIFSTPGIGNQYFQRINSKNNQYNGEKTRDYYVTRQGVKLALPIYYRNKIYNDEEREKLWINILNKEERWVDGQKIEYKTKEDNEKYIKVRNEARIKNKRLGYGELNNWEEWRYENERRMIKKQEREQKIKKFK